MVMIYLGLPPLGIRFGVLTSVIVALVLNEAAYMAEIIRGGFLPAGQHDAAEGARSVALAGGFDQGAAAASFDRAHRVDATKVETLAPTVEQGALQR
jgi:hypothetical protein